MKYKHKEHVEYKSQQSFEDQDNILRSIMGMQRLACTFHDCVDVDVDDYDEPAMMVMLLGLLVVVMEDDDDDYDNDETMRHLVRANITSSEVV